MKIKILSSGCPNSIRFENNVRQILKENEILNLIEKKISEQNNEAATSKVNDVAKKKMGSKKNV